MINVSEIINTVICDDCLNVMRQLPDKCIDLVLTDPPYGIGRDGSARSTSRHGGRKSHKFMGWDNQTPDENYFNEIFRISKNQIIFGGNYFTKHLPASMGWIFWDKGQRICNSDGELIFTSFKKALRVYLYNRVELLIEGTDHPTQKPIKLIQEIIQNYSQPGMTIFDPFAGSGTTAIACLETGRNYILIEKEPDYIEIINKRIAQWREQGRMFA